VAILTLLVLVTAANVLGTALSPLLLVKSPLLLVAMSAATHHVALAAASVDPLPLIAIATLRRTLTSLAAFGLGALYGPAAVAWLEKRYPRLARLVRLLEQLFARWGVLLVAALPLPTVAVLAGAARTRLLSFLTALVLGITLWTSVTYTLGDALSVWTGSITAYLQEHLVESTLACVAAIALQQGYVRLLRLRAQRQPELVVSAPNTGRLIDDAKRRTSA
jgi:membrane protein DedA with SNARE-associated domain